MAKIEREQVWEHEGHEAKLVEETAVVEGKEFDSLDEATDYLTRKNSSNSEGDPDR